HFFSTVKELDYIEPHECGRNHAEIGKRGIASADAGDAVTNVTEAVGLGGFLQLRTGICDGDETISCTLGAQYCFHPLIKVLLKDIGFERCPGLTGDDKESLG